MILRSKSIGSRAAASESRSCEARCEVVCLTESAIPDHLKKAEREAHISISNCTLKTKQSNTMIEREEKESFSVRETSISRKELTISDSYVMKSN